MQSKEFREILMTKMRNFDLKMEALRSCATAQVN